MAEITGSREAGRKRRALLLASSFLTLAPLWTSTGPVLAQSATWLASPGSGDFYDANNWSPASVPTGTATFGTSATTTLTLGAAGSIGGWTFDASASNYTFNISAVSQAFTGTGITINGGSATILNDGLLTFYNTSTAGNAALVNKAGATVDFSNSTGPNGDGKLSAGSIAGGGSYILGANELTVGSNNLTTEVSGVISGSGSLVKTGTGTLMLTGANTYTGGTTISGFGSDLWLGNTTGGVGSILGAVTVGSGSSFKIVDADTSGITTITNDGTMFFYNSTTAGSAAITTNHTLSFANNSSADHATITNNGHLNFYASSSAGNADIANNYILTFNDTATAGSATITSSNASSAIFMYFYVNSTAGSATITNGNNSYLNFFDNSTAGSASFTNNSYMYFKNSSSADTATIDNTNGTTFFYNNSSGGNAAITNNAGGTTYFYENSTAGNAQLINNAANAVFDFSYGTGPNGDNKLSAGSIAGSGTFSLGANALTVGSNNLSTTVSGVIADGGANGGTGASLVKAGTGTLTLSGTNTYTGGTTFAGGTVSVSSDVNLGDAAGGLIFNGGALRVTGTAFTSTARDVTLGAGGGTFDIASAGNTFTLSQALTGSGGLTKAGSGTLTLSGAHTYTGATTVNAGNLTIQGSIASSTVTNNATLVYANSAMAGTASITNNNLLQFLGTSTASSAAINNSAGILQFFIASTAGNAVINNGGSGAIDFFGSSTAGSATITNGNDLYFFDNSTAGNAAIANNAGGTVNFSNSTGPNGDNKLSAGSIAGAGNFVLGANELTVGSSNISTEVDGVISGNGSLVKTGTGRLTLSGTNGYIGATTVNGGTLAVNGDISASSGVTVNGGGTLGGNGLLPTTVINGGATLAPGNSIGTLTVIGNLTFNSGGIYTVEVSPTAADRTNVIGTATLTGATVQAVALAGSFRQQTYTILNATGGFGGTQFAGLTGSSFAPGARNPHLTYDANNVYLVLDPGTLPVPAGASGNQSSVAGAINGFVENGGTPPAGFDALLNMSGTQLTNALNQVSGQPAGGAATSGTQMTTSFMTLMLNPFSGGGSSSGGGALGYARGFGAGDTPKAAEAYAAVTPKDRQTLAASFNQRWSVWGSGYGGTSQRGGDASTGSADTSTRTYGFAAGADYRPAADWLVGFALAGGSTSWSLSQGLGGGKADVFQLGAFASKAFGMAYVSGALTYAWHDVTTDRTVTVSGIDKLEARYHAHSFGARLEAGYRLLTPWLGVTPYAALQAQSFRTPSYGETATSGSNTFALAYSAKTSKTLRTELGAWFHKGFALDSGDLLTLRSRAAWAHDHANDNSINAAFQTLPGSSFTVNGAAAPKNAALVSLGGEWQRGRVTLSARLDGEFAQHSQNYSGTGSLRYAW